MTTCFTSSDLFVFDISSKLESIEWSLDCVRTCWFVERALSFFKRLHSSINCSINCTLLKSLLKRICEICLLCFLYLLQIYNLLKVELKEFWKVGSFNFFSKTSSLSSPIKFLRFKQLPSFLTLFMHTL